MNFSTFRNTVRQRAMVCGGRSSYALMRHRRKSDKVTAAAVLVLRDRGPAWALANPGQFQSEVLQYLGLATRLALFVGGLFLGGGSIWLTLARILLPIVRNIVTDKSTSAGFGAAKIEIDGMAVDAHRTLKGKKS